MRDDVHDLKQFMREFFSSPGRGERRAREKRGERSLDQSMLNRRDFVSSFFLSPLPLISLR